MLVLILCLDLLHLVRDRLYAKNSHVPELLQPNVNRVGKFLHCWSCCCLDLLGPVVFVQLMYWYAHPNASMRCELPRQFLLSIKLANWGDSSGFRLLLCDRYVDCCERLRCLDLCSHVCDILETLKKSTSSDAIVTTG
jgi:hypothetical protein